MEANNFIAKLKACGANSDICDLKEALDAFKVILVKLPEKDKSSFSLNVLCTLCRNLEKIPTWRASINNTDLVTFGIECVRHTRNMQATDQVKTLACIFHIHRHVIKQSSNIPPELILKLSFLPFDCDEDSLLSDYHKTYWSILADRLTYIEKLKSLKLPIIKLLPKFVDDTIKVIKIYDTIQFCANLLTFLVKKLHYVYNNVRINESFERIFQCIAKKDIKQFKLLQDKEIMDIYVKFNDCLYIIAENGLRYNDSVLENVSRTIITILGHRPDMFHCMQMLYPNAFCCIFKDKTNVNLIDNILNSLLTSCEITEKLGYTQTLNATYPYLSQLLRLYIESILNNQDISKSFGITIQEKCLKLILFLIKKLKNTNQMLKCENCNIRSGLHDALRLTFLIKNFVNTSTSNDMDIKTILPLYIDVIKQQYVILEELNVLGCGNYKKCLSKLQTDTHNTAITFNKCKYYIQSIELFDIYLKNEFKKPSSGDKAMQMKNMSRALYNKSICQLDFRLYEDSLNNAYLSLIFSLPDSICNEKYMSLVMDIKAKASKEETDVQMWSVLDVCRNVVNENPYGNLQSLVKDLEFSVLLKLEFSMYVKLWPSIPPIAGVWKSLYDMIEDNEDFITKENPEKVLWTLYEIVVATPAAVRTIHNDTYKDIVYRLIEELRGKPKKSPKEKLVYATLLSLKTEYEINEAGLKYGWKGREMDPDAPSTRSILHEREVLHNARMTVKEMSNVTGDCFGDFLAPCLRVLSVVVPELFHLSDDVHALQLADVLCDMAIKINEREIFVRNAGYLIYKSDGQTDLQELIEKASKYCKEMINEPQYMDAALNFMCEVAIYYMKLDKLSISSKLVQSVQVKILTAYENNQDINLDLSLGRLMEAQTQLCSVLSEDCPSMLSALNSVHRHYLSMASSDTHWCFRRHTSLVIKLRVSTSGARCVSLSRALRAFSRARAGAAVASRTGAAGAARILAHVMTGGEDLQMKIDNTLKFILGIQSDAIETNHTMTKQHHFTPKSTNLEAMRDCMLKKVQTSPTIPCTIPVFQIPDFLNHACTCNCHACQLPACIIIACQICFLEASAYFRDKENEIARNYFNGALNAFEKAEIKLKKTFDNYKKCLKDYIVDLERRNVEQDFKLVQVEFYIELSYFELSEGDFVTSDEYILKIHEIMSEMREVDPYLRNEVYNLMVASAQLRKDVKKPKEIGLEFDLENLKLSPDKDLEIQKTPEAKIAVPKIGTVKIVKDEEIPKRRKVIKLNLDEASEENEEKITRSKTKKPQFKIPDPVTSKPVLETITPRPTRSRPEIIIQQPSLDQTDIKIFTPKTSNTNDFFTPSESTPAEQFFTPQTSIKTYSRRIIKNLEKEFSTPQGKENPQNPPNSVKKVDSVKVLKDKRVLRRATSPGKLVQKPESRPRRIKQPVID